MHVSTLKGSPEQSHLEFDSFAKCLDRIRNDLNFVLEVGYDITMKYTIESSVSSSDEEHYSNSKNKNSQESEEYFFVELYKILDSNEGRAEFKGPVRVVNSSIVTIKFFSIRSSNRDSYGAGYVLSMHDSQSKIDALSVIMQRDASILRYFSEYDITRMMLEVTKVALPIIERAEKTIETCGAPIPLEAPEKWAERSTKRGENPAEFTQRVYGRWLGKGLTRGDIQRADGALWTALEQWRHRHGLPFDLPKRVESIAQPARLLSPSAPVTSSSELQSRVDSSQNAQQPLPSIAPEEWTRRSKPRNENPIEFTKRVYRQWLGGGLTQAHILHLDRPLYMALAKWTQRHGPSGLALPTRSDLIDRRLKNGLPQP